MTTPFQNLSPRKARTLVRKSYSRALLFLLQVTHQLLEQQPSFTSRSKLSMVLENVRVYAWYSLALGVLHTGVSLGFVVSCLASSPSSHLGLASLVLTYWLHNAPGIIDTACTPCTLGGGTCMYVRSRQSVSHSCCVTYLRVRSAWFRGCALNASDI